MFLQRTPTAVPGHITDVVQIRVLTDHVQDMILSEEHTWDFLSGCRGVVGLNHLLAISAPTLRHRSVRRCFPLEHS